MIFFNEPVDCDEPQCPVHGDPSGWSVVYYELEDFWLQRKVFFCQDCTVDALEVLSPDMWRDFARSYLYVQYAFQESMEWRVRYWEIEALRAMLRIQKPILETPARSDT